MKLFEPRGSHGIEKREQHFPGQATVDAYGNGGFRFADMSHRGSILCLPSGVYGWEAIEAKEITAEALSPVISEAGAVDVVLIGTGKDLRPLSKPAAEALKAAGIRHEVMPTGAAIRIYNIMLGERRKFAAALLAVD